MRRKAWFAHPYPTRCNARQRIGGQIDAESGRKCLDKMPAIKPLLWADIVMDVSSESSRTMRHYTDLRQKWFTPPDDDWEE